jgi:putative zinc finger protein
VIGRRTHDPERSAAAYVSGEMRQRERRRFEAHLLVCEECWREVSLGWRGRGRAEASREIAPAGLRDEIRAALSIEPHSSRLPRRLVLGTTAVVLIVLSIFSAEEIRDRHQPPTIAAAVAAAHTETLASRGPSTREPPDLSSQGLRLIMGERVDLAGLTSDAFMYRDEAGESVLLFVSGSPFPVARGATPRTAGGEGWRAQSEGMTLVCGDRPVNYLVISENPSLVGPVEHMITTTNASPA